MTSSLAYEPIKFVDLKVIDEFRQTFREQTQSEARYIIRAPGRVNLIGDHIDYHGFSVLPMTIENSILLGCSFASRIIDGDTKGSVNILNTESHQYPNFTCNHSFAHGSKLDESHVWYNYVLCGYHGILANQLLHIDANQVYLHAKDIVKCKLEAQQIEQEQSNHIIPNLKQDDILKDLPNFNILVDSSLPPAAGLSSSSALVCASAIATYLFLLEQTSEEKELNRLQIDSRIMAEKCALFEHLIGIRGGGMDQAVIMTAQEGYAKHVTFVPDLMCENVRLPGHVTWLVAHCGHNHPKATTSAFNTRVFETKLGAALLLKHHSKAPCQVDHTITLGRIKSDFYPNVSACDIVRQIRIIFEKSSLTIEEISSRLEMSPAELIERFKISEEFIRENPNFTKNIQVLKRCEHVFMEAERVEKFKRICDTTMDAHELGALMNESHCSLRDKYECSHESLDRLVDIATQAGALGARLTGAGWGGCIVALCESNKCDIVLDKLKTVSKLAFRAEPQSGCTIMKV